MFSLQMDGAGGVFGGWGQVCSEDGRLKGFRLLIHASSYG